MLSTSYLTGLQHGRSNEVCVDEATFVPSSFKQQNFFLFEHFFIHVIVKHEKCHWYTNVCILLKGLPKTDVEINYCTLRDKTNYSEASI